MKTVQLLLSVALYTSTLFGLQILLMDRWLWNSSPTHAFGLVVFVGIDAILLIVMSVNTGLGSAGALLASLVQLGAMASDLVSGQPIGVSTETFRDYLLTNTGFVSLFIVQVVTMVLSAVTVTGPYLHGHRLRFPKTRNY
jgi:hypothetical protein